MDTHVYIDGFNLYYGLLKGTPFRWLNLERLVDLLLPKNDVKTIYYFTAKVDGRDHDPDQPLRQQMYLRALQTLPRVRIEYGTFLSSVVRRPQVETNPANPKRHSEEQGTPLLSTNPDGTTKLVHVLKTEEKGSDVNLAAFLLRDAFQKNCECHVVVSNDSDLLTPIRIAKHECGATIGLIPPRKFGSHELKALADFVIHPRTHHLENAKFPDILRDQVGEFHKPPGW
ncbi:MAG: NYN domain-containing protein [Rhizomicrobium sp.]|nr:NYN domain-containing protein [Rhizomicrobium sp.]